MLLIATLVNHAKEILRIVSNLDKEVLKESRAIIGFNYCEKIYKIEKELREKYTDKDDFFEIRYKERLNQTEPILNEFEKHVKVEIENALPRSALGQALDYSQKLLPNMKTILKDGYLDVDNNAAESAIKPFIIRKEKLAIHQYWKRCKVKCYYL